MKFNGIFHYKPIFGQETLDKIQRNDLQKVNKCRELEIFLIHIDSSNQKRVAEKTSKPYLILLENEINKILSLTLD